MSPETKKKKRIRRRVQKKPAAKAPVQAAKPATKPAAEPELPDFTIDPEHSAALKKHMQEVQGGGIINISL